MMPRSWALARLPLGAVAAVVVALACGGGAEYDVPAGQVQVVQDGSVLGQLPRTGGLDDLASRVQFPILQPGYVPDGGFRLVAVEARLPNPIEALGDDGRSNGVGVLLWMDGKSDDPDTSRIYLVQYSRTGEPPEGLAEVDSGVEGVRYFWSDAGGAGDAAWITAERAFTLETSGPDAPGEDEVRKLFQSLR